MKLPATALPALLALLAVAVQARPDGAAPASDTPSTASPAADSSADSSSASHEADVNSSSAEDDNMTVQGKAAALCPPRQPELLALEAECAQDEHAECSTTPAPMGETTAETAEATEAAAAATTTEAAAAASAGTTEAPASATTESAPKQRRQRKRTCNYHLCVLKKLEVLDSSDMPDKTLLTNWIANNVTDENQREKLQQKFTECVSSLKDVFRDSSENSKSTEEDTAEEKKEETQPKKKSCVAAKRVISCMSKSVECPVLKF